MNGSLGISKLATKFWHNTITPSVRRAKQKPTKIPFSSAFGNHEAFGVIERAISPFFLLWVKVKKVIKLVIMMEKSTGGTKFFIKVELSSLNKTVETFHRITVGMRVLTTKFPKKDFTVFSLIYFSILFTFSILKHQSWIWFFCWYRLYNVPMFHNFNTVRRIDFQSKKISHRHPQCVG